MKTKLSLSLDDLTVDSFTTETEALQKKGTVQGYATNALNSECCWNTDTTCPGGGDGSYWCGDDNTGGPSHMASCGEFCDITGIPYKCNNYTEIC